MTATDHHAALLAHGLLGRIATRNVPTHLRRSLYEAEKAGLAKYDGAVCYGRNGVTTFYYIFG